jgi:hypothetical protein
MKDLIKNRLNEGFVFELIKNVMDEDYPASFNMEEFKSLNKFSERVRYCDKHLKKISSGSARIVYMVDDTKVLKLAKNKKGIAQCETEIKWGNERYFSDILAKTIDFSEDNLWVEMELARRVKKSDFKRLEGFDFGEYGRYLTNFYAENNGRRAIFGVDPEQEAIMDESDFVNSVKEFMTNTDSPAGDLARLNSYGIVTREGTDSIVIIDFGLTGEVYSTYYDFRRVA